MFGIVAYLHRSVNDTCGGNAGGRRLDPNAGAVFGQHHPVGAVPGGVLRRPVRDEVARAGGGGTARRGANAQPLTNQSRLYQSSIRYSSGD